MSDDLVQFLRARLDEDAAAAKRVESRWRQIGETGVIVASDGDRAEECANGNWTGIAEHIVRHDPARVLAEVEAKRGLMRIHKRPSAASWEPNRCVGCGVEGYNDNPVTENINDCPELRVLSRVYRDHSDFNPVWLED